MRVLGFGVCVSVIVFVIVLVLVCTRMCGHAPTLAGELMCWQRQHLAPFASPLAHLARNAMFPPSSNPSPPPSNPSRPS